MSTARLSLLDLVAWSMVAAAACGAMALGSMAAHPPDAVASPSTRQASGLHRATRPHHGQGDLATAGHAPVAEASTPAGHAPVPQVVAAHTAR